MKKRSPFDLCWLIKYRFLVRLGRDPLKKKNGVRRQYKRIGFKRISSPGAKANQTFRSALACPRFFIARIGYTECRTFGFFRQYECGLLKTFPEERRVLAKELSGIFSNDDHGLSLFCDVFIENLNKVTHLGVFSTEFEPLLISHYCNKNVKLFHASAFEHFNQSPSWMSLLHGKRILVVSPFADSIKTQYEKRDRLFSDQSSNPLFASLQVVKAEVTFAKNGNRFKDWITTLYNMYERCMECDFDIAIVSCGGYGLPLGGMLYSSGKNVIHAGGIAQLYFGIYGKRYETPHYSPFINEAWVRPSSDERPNGFKSVEDGTYW